MSGMLAVTALGADVKIGQMKNIGFRNSPHNNDNSKSDCFYQVIQYLPSIASFWLQYLLSCI